MKLSKVVILSLGMALCAAGGVGTAFAAISRQGTEEFSTSDASYDKAIYLKWGDAESGTSLGDIDLESASGVAYRCLVVSPQSSKTVDGTVTVSFELKASGENGVTNGISIDVYTIASKPNDNYETLISAGTKEFTLNTSNLTDDAEFDVTGDRSAVTTTTHYYAIKVSYDTSEVPAGKSLSAQLDITQSFVAD